MRKKIFLWSAYGISVLVLIFAFENIGNSQTALLLFYEREVNSTILIFFSSLLGFLIGFFLMLYTHEVKKEKESLEESEALGAAPSVLAEQAPQKKEEKTEKQPRLDEFEDEDEVLG